MKRLIPIFIATLFSALSLNVLAGGNAEAGKSIAAQTCAGCHGADGNSTMPQYPRLAGQQADYIVRALMDYKSGARNNPIMKGFATGLSEQDMKNVAAWFSHQSGLITPVLPRTVTK